MNGLRRLGAAVLLLPGLVWGQGGGFKPILGGFPYDSGLAVGVEYRKESLAKLPVDFHGSAIGSVKKYHALQLGLRLPRLGPGGLYAEATARLWNYPEEDFWGIGPRSSRARRTTYRYEDFGTSGVVGFRPVPWLKTGVAGGRLDVNAGRGKDANWPSIEERFVPGEVPGLERQSDYWHFGAFLEADRRDVRNDPRKGGFYRFLYMDYFERQSNGLDFRRYEIDLRKFLSVREERTTFAARAFTVLTKAKAGGQVPFFLQPTVGGGNDLRGYAQYRFRDENALGLSLESRWRFKGMFQAVGFADAGRVFDRPGKIGLRGLRGSIGGGGRVVLGSSLVLGADVGWSPDGFRFWFRGSQSF